MLAGTLLSFAKANDWEHFSSALKFWDTETGDEVFSIPSGVNGVHDDAFFGMKASPDGQTIAAVSFQMLSNKLREGAQLMLVDVAQRTKKTVDLAPACAIFRELMFHPSGKWLVVPFQMMAERLGRDAQPDDLPQPRIALVDARSGQILETLVSPQVFVSSIAFSPDGNTLATSGWGEVLLWDFSAPPALARITPKP